MKRILRKFRRDESGTVLAQYLLVMGAFVVAGAGAIFLLTKGVDTTVDRATGYQEEIVSRKLKPPAE